MLDSPVLLRRLPFGGRVDETTRKQASSATSVLVSPACSLTVVYWLPYPFILSGMVNQSMKLGLLPTYTATSQVELAKELSRLIEARSLAD